MCNSALRLLYKKKKITREREHAQIVNLILINVILLPLSMGFCKRMLFFWICFQSVTCFHKRSLQLIFWPSFFYIYIYAFCCYFLNPMSVYTRRFVIRMRSSWNASIKTMTRYSFRETKPTLPSFNTRMRLRII